MTVVMEALRRVLEWLTVGLVAFITILVTAEVILRGLFDYPLIVTDEASRYLMIWIVMLAGALVTQTDDHIRIEMLPKTLSFPVRKMLRIGSQVLVIVFLTVFLVATLTILPGMRGDRTVTLGISMFWVYLSLPVGAILMLTVTAWNTWRVLRARNDSELALDPTTAGPT
jgi:C4-dicarboxylate transporter DctQ subunit